MHTVSAFYTALLASGASDVAIAAVQDQTIQTVNNRIFLPRNRQLLAGFGGGTALTIVRLDSGTLRLNGAPIIYPLDSGTAGGSLPGYAWYGPWGITLPGLEQIACLGSRAVAAAADAFAFLWHADRFVAATPGPTKTVRATSAVIFAAGTWTSGAITLDTALSEGTYQVVGMAAQGTNLLAARLIFPGQTERPGVLAVDAVSQFIFPTWRFGNSGVFGQFTNYLPPQIEMLGVGAGTTQELYLDLIKIR